MNARFLFKSTQIFTPPPDHIAEVNFTVEIMNTRQDVFIRFNQWGELLDYHPTWYDLPISARRLILSEAQHEALEERLENWAERLNYLLPVMTIQIMQKEKWPEKVDELRETVKVLFLDRTNWGEYSGKNFWIKKVQHSLKEKLPLDTIYKGILLALTEIENKQAEGINLLRQNPALAYPLLSLIGEYKHNNRPEFAYLGNEEFLKLTEKKLLSSNSAIRHHAISILGNSRYYPAVTMLVKHLTHCKEDISQVLFKFQYSSVDSRMTPLFIEALLKTEDEEDIKNFLSCIAIKDNSSIRSIILEYLDHPSDIIKIGAIECLQQSTQDDAAEAKLIELLEKVQGNWIFMKEIAKALNSVGSKKCVSVLVRSLSTVKQYLPEDSKADHCFSQLLRALNTFGEQKIVREHLYHLYSIKDLIHEYWELIHPIQDLYSNENLPFLETLLSKDNDTLLHLIGATLYRINTLESRAVLIRALKNPNIKISTEAVKILGIMRCKESVPAILEYFSQYPNHDLVLRSLIRIGDPKSIEPIYESIKNSKQEVQIIDKWNALGRLQDKRAIEPLCMYLKSGIPDELKAKIIITLSLWPEANTISFLRTQLGKETPEIEGLLLMALGRLKDTYSRKILLEAFKSKKNYIFGGAAIGLGFMDIDNYSTYVMEAANIYESNIRIPAKRLIFTLSNPLITQKFLNSQKESIADIKIENINIMGYTGNPTFIPPLIAALKDPFIHVRQAAIQALTCFDRPDVKTALTEMLADSHKGVADDAKKALNLAPRESFVFISDQVINPWPNDIFNDSRF